MGKYLIISTVCLVISALLITGSAAGNSPDELKQLLSSLNDPKISVLDLAFFLATHNYDARPANGYVELKLDGKAYKLIPNSDQGLCTIIPLNGS